MKEGSHQNPKRKRAEEKNGEDEPIQKKFGQGKNDVGGLNFGERKFQKEKASVKTEIKGWYCKEFTSKV